MTYGEKLEQKKEKALETLKLYDSLDDKLFVIVYKETMEEFKSLNLWDGVREVEEKYKGKYDLLNDDRDIDQRIEDFKKNNPVKAMIRR